MAEVNRQAVAARLGDHIRRNLSHDPDQPISGDTPLISSGLLDSLSLVEVLVFVEDTFGVVIPDEAATAEAMDSVDRIVQLMEVYRATPV
jgi:acyl carrier protein